MAQCLQPFFGSNPSPTPGREKIAFPCGKCPICLQRRASSWAFRLEQELKQFDSAAFVTLTYEEPPISKKGFMTLVKRDWQLFMKRLRQYHSKGTLIKYYAVGEYGSKRMRPHFHAIMFGADPELIYKAWDREFYDRDKSKFPKNLFRSGMPGWNNDVDSDVNAANIAYVTKYMTKGKKIPVHKNDDRTPEFALSSQGLGKSYKTDAMLAYHHADLDRFFVTRPDGIKVAMPRYLKNLIYNEDQQKEHSKRVADLYSDKLSKEIAEFEKTRPGQNFYKSRYETFHHIMTTAFKKATDDRDDL